MGSRQHLGLHPALEHLECWGQRAGSGSNKRRFLLDSKSSGSVEILDERFLVNGEYLAKDEIPALLYQTRPGYGSMIRWINLP